MNNNVYGIYLGTVNFKIFCKSTGKILKEKNTIAIIGKDQIYAFGDRAYAMYEKAPESNSDAENEKTTYATLVGIEKAKSDVKKLTNAAINQLSVFENSEFLKALALSLINRKKQF